MATLDVSLIPLITANIGCVALASTIWYYTKLHKLHECNCGKIWQRKLEIRTKRKKNEKNLSKKIVEMFFVYAVFTGFFFFILSWFLRYKPQRYQSLYSNPPWFTKNHEEKGRRKI